MEKAVLLAPTTVARAAVRYARRPEERWLLRQPRALRASYVRAVLDPDSEPKADEIWMLRQSQSVRESYIREVLREDDPARRAD